MYSLFFDELYHLTAINPSLHEILPQHLTFLKDEFANVTLPDSFMEKLSTMRSRNMSVVIIVQNLIQLKRKFPKFDMDKDLIGNCSIIYKIIILRKSLRTVSYKRVQLFENFE